jgi:broad specificity phosphatase PhoE
MRHAEVYNPEEIYYGRLPGYRLSDNGRRQAQAAAETLCHKELAAIYTSPMLRARQTARILQALHPTTPVRVSSLLQEVYTPFDGMTHEELLARDWDLYSDTAAHFETPADVLGRVRQFIERARRRHAGQEIVAVTHGDVLCFLLLWLDGRAVGVQGKVHLPNICLTDEYPAPASLVEVVFRSADIAEQPAFSYFRPYA